jgi:hypothetical protein
MNDLIEKAINTDSSRLKEMSIAARNRIQQEFNLQKRKDAFYHLVG